MDIIKTFAEIASLALIIVFMFTLYLAATPDCVSGECELARAEQTTIK